jgi:hypothetical protein
MQHASVSEISGEAPPLYSDWHTPNERRIDGDRITELVPAREWLSGRAPGNRGPDTNPLIEDPRWEHPPHLPRPEVLLSAGANRFRRDHLHDRNREHAVYDRANPGLATYVRVTRRRCDPFVEQQIAQVRANVRDGELEKEKIETRLSNELLEVRSQSLRKAMADKSRLNSRVMAGTWNKPPSTAPAASRDPLGKRSEELEARLRVLQRMSGLQVQAAAAAGRDISDPSTAPEPAADSLPASLLPPPPAAPTPKQRSYHSMAGASAKEVRATPSVTTRHGWPVDSYYSGATGPAYETEHGPGYPTHLKKWQKKMDRVNVRDPPRQPKVLQGYAGPGYAASDHYTRSIFKGSLPGGKDPFTNYGELSA